MGRKTTEKLDSLALCTFKIDVGPSIPVSRATLQLAQTCHVNRMPYGGLDSPSVCAPYWMGTRTKKKIYGTLLLDFTCH